MVYYKCTPYLDAHIDHMAAYRYIFHAGGGSSRTRQQECHASWAYPKENPSENTSTEQIVQKSPMSSKGLVSQNGAELIPTVTRSSVTRGKTNIDPQVLAAFEPAPLREHPYHAASAPSHFRLFCLLRCGFVDVRISPKDSFDPVAALLLSRDLSLIIYIIL
jgi:hypothetical protein